MCHPEINRQHDSHDSVTMVLKAVRCVYTIYLSSSSSMTSVDKLYYTLKSTFYETMRTSSRLLD